MALADSLTVFSTPFERLDNGLWIASTSSADQPYYLRIKSEVNPDTVANYLVRCEQYLNSLTPGAPDDVLSAHMVIRGSLKRFTQANIESAVDNVYHVLRGLTAANVPATNSGQMTRILRGER